MKRKEQVFKRMRCAGIYKYFFVALFITVLSFFFLVSPTHATMCYVGGDSWYIPQIKIDKETLPFGVSEVIQGAPHDEYSLQNLSDTPLYLLDKTTDLRPEHIRYNNTELPNNVLPYKKLVVGKVFSYILGTPTYDRAQNLNVYDGRWEEDRGGYNNEHRNLFSLDVPNLQKLGVFVIAKNEDNRPSTVVVPPESEFSLDSFYGDKPFKISGTLSYLLNKEYDPQAEQKKQESCQQNTLSGGSELPSWALYFLRPFAYILLVLSFLPIKIVALGIVAIVGFILWKKRR